MKYNFPESTIENPLKFFEFAYSMDGQNQLRKEYLSDTFDIDELGDPKFDLDKDFVYNVYSDEETGECHKYKYWFKDYLNAEFKVQRNKSHNFFILRLDLCNLFQGEKYVLQKFLRIMDNCLIWVGNSNIPLLKSHLYYIKRFKTDLEQLFNFRTGLSTKSLQEIEIEKLKKIISELNFIEIGSNDTFLHFLLCQDTNFVKSKIQVRCDNRQFHYIMEKFMSIGYPISFGMNELIKSKIFLRASDKSPFTYSNVYNVSSKNKINKPKKAKEFDSLFSQF